MTVLQADLSGARRRLPQPHRIQGAWAAVVGLVMAVTAALGLYSCIAGLRG